MTRKSRHARRRPSPRPPLPSNVDRDPLSGMASPEAEAARARGRGVERRSKGGEIGGATNRSGGQPREGQERHFGTLSAFTERQRADSCGSPGAGGGSSQPSTGVGKSGAGVATALAPGRGRAAQPDQ